jgi:hypothetical protein
MKECIAFLIRPEKTVDSICDAFYFSVPKTSDIWNPNFRDAASAIKGIKNPIGTLIGPAAVSYFLQEIKQVRNLRFIVICQTIEPSLNGTTLRQRLKGEKLPTPCFLNGHRIAQQN